MAAVLCRAAWTALRAGMRLCEKQTEKTKQGVTSFKKILNVFARHKKRTERLRKGCICFFCLKKGKTVAALMKVYTVVFCFA